jgi:hypothetical protein
VELSNTKTRAAYLLILDRSTHQHAVVSYGTFRNQTGMNECLQDGEQVARADHADRCADGA